MARTAVIVPEQRGRLGFSHYAIRTVLGTQRGPVDWERAGEEAFGVATIGIGAVKGTKVVSGGKSITRVVKAASTEGKKDFLKLVEMNIKNNEKTVIGHWDSITGGYIAKAKKMNASYFDLGDVWNSLTVAERKAANQYFLDIIANNGDDIYLSVPKSHIKADSWLQWEIQTLTETKGYRWVNQWMLRKEK
ncbi:hypothetical protein [Thermospira aquatica]|uniref:Uncharacterized protein n=1 Tax=Thermospira aquatica TaxID=2828656 RepID=A0AAX3BA82_9SPIR|nr:hypothetical protein [Thermospira aquatica]URA09145.1 hypothetical protein KDW03_06445 [Thermospira aquatica]